MADDLGKLAIHTMTHKPWTLRQCIDAFTKAGLGGISVWRDVIEPIGADEARKMLRDSGLKVPALVRGGFFPAVDPGDRQKAIDVNRRYIDEAAAIGAEMVVLVVGAVPGMPMDEARMHVTDGIGALLPHAVKRNIKLAIEPLHPMYAADRSCINRMREARKVCEQLRSRMVGVAVDVYHVWWDPDLEKEIELAGKQHTLFGLHLSDWRVNTRDLLNDRGLMGDGCIDIKTIRHRAKRAGFNGMDEVEVFSDAYWAMDQSAYLDKIIERYRGCC
jgi:sugar phosphate isomerase/epimerase